jgi:hypothetical protein
LYLKSQSFLKATFFSHKQHKKIQKDNARHSQLHLDQAGGERILSE